jgi:hypothetical protein
MTRRHLNRTLRRVYIFLGLVLAISLFAKFADHMGLPKAMLEGLKDVYEFFRDMALLIATGGVAYITNVFQKRQSFMDSLRKEWNDIISAKSAVYAYTHHERPSIGQYLAAFTRLSETIDNMRIVYRNVGETSELIGLYPFAPLHDMRRALQTLDPRKNPEASADQRKLVRDAMLQSFYALRETFLEELDLEEPTNPLLIFGARRLQKGGQTEAARALRDAQRARQNGIGHAGDKDIEHLLEQLYEKEAKTPKAWRAVEGQTDDSVGNSGGTAKG